MELVGNTRQAIESIDFIDKDTYLKPVVDVETAFSQTNIDSPWHIFNAHISDSTLLGLAFCSDTLSREMPESVIDQEVLDQLRTEIELMIADILNSSIDERLKAVIIDHLESIRRALIEYRIRGSEGLRRALDSGIGTLIRHQEEMRKPENASILSKLLSVFKKIDSYVEVGITAKRLFSNVTELLQLPGG
jgi:hypothetical protein